MMTIKKYTFKQRSQEWLDLRQKNITATEASALLGLNKYKTPLKIRKDKLGQGSSLIDNAYMRAGRLLEPSVFVALNELGANCKQASSENVIMYVDDNVRLSCSLDGFGRAKDGEYYLVECKTANPKAYEKWANDAPYEYQIQLQVQLHLTKLEYGLLACLSQEFPFELTVYKLYSNRFVQDIICEQVKKFFTCLDKNVTFKVDKEIAPKIVESLNETTELIYG